MARVGGCGGLGRFERFFGREADIVDAFYLADLVAVTTAVSENTETRDADGFNETAAVRHEVHVDDVEECAVLIEGDVPELALGFVRGVVEQHSEIAVTFHSSPDHKSISGFEDMQEGGYGWKGERADEQWCI